MATADTAAVGFARPLGADDRGCLRVVTFGSTHPFTSAAVEVLRSVEGFERVGHVATFDERLVFRDPNSVGARALLESLEPDLFLSAGYGRILREETLAIPTIGAINVHPSLLPAFRGYEAPRWALYFGERRTGITVHEMVLPPDSGPILVQGSCALDLDEEPDAVYERLTGLIPEALRTALEAIRATGRLQGQPQNTRTPIFRKPWHEEARLELDLSLPAQEIVRRAHVFEGLCNVQAGRWRVFFASVEPSELPPKQAVRRRWRYVDVRTAGGGAVRLRLKRPLRSWAKLELAQARRRLHRRDDPELYADLFARAKTAAHDVN